MDKSEITEIKTEPEIAGIQYYNVTFYLLLVTDVDKENYRIFSDVVQNNALLMRDIVKWCNGHNIKYKMKFRYRKDFPLKGNIWNFYSYLRFRVTEG
jgi:hypothetical protein